MLEIFKIDIRETFLNKLTLMLQAKLFPIDTKVCLFKKNSIKECSSNLNPSLMQIKHKSLFTELSNLAQKFYVFMKYQPLFIQ